MRFAALLGFWIGVCRCMNEDFLLLGPGAKANPDTLNPCNGSWSFSNITLRVPFKVLENSSGRYDCSDPEMSVRLLVAEKLQFGVYPRPLEVLGSANFICLTSIWPPIGSVMNNSIWMEDVYGYALELEEKTERADLENVNLFIRHVSWLPTYGQVTYKCIWQFEMCHEGNCIGTKKEVQMFAKVYLPVQDPEPDKTTVIINEPINCSAEAYPEASYDWSCTRAKDQSIDGWRSDGPLLYFTSPGRFECICMAVNSFYNKIYNKTWAGRLTALGSDGSEYEEDVNVGSDSSNIEFMALFIPLVWSLLE